MEILQLTGIILLKISQWRRFLTLNLLGSSSLGDLKAAERITRGKNESERGTSALVNTNVIVYGLKAKSRKTRISSFNIDLIDS